MLRLTLRSIWSHKRRLVSTIVAVVLGVAFMSGTLVLGDTLDKTFDDLFADVNDATDVQVQGTKLFGGGFGSSDARNTLDVALGDTLLGVDGVREVAPFVQSVGFGPSNRILDANGDPIGPTQGPPTLLDNFLGDIDLNPFRLVEGRGPESDDEFVLNLAAVDDADFAVGDSVDILTQFGKATYHLVGVTKFGEAETAGGAITASFTLAEAQRIAGLDGQVQTFLVGGDGSASDEALVAAIAPVLPETAEAITGAQAAEQLSDDVTSGFQFFSVLLTVFASIALIVGTFIIVNTFSILVAQRTRELALLRAIGASRRQVLTSVMLEATVIGTIASIVGLGVGILLAQTGIQLMVASGGDLPTSSLIVSPATVVTAFVAGAGVTLVASIAPAIGATRVPPLAALREVAIDRSGASRVRIVGGALIVALAAFLLATGVANGTTDALGGVGMGALALLVGAIVVGPAVAERSIRILGGWLPRLKGVTGQISMENAARSPKRTSATASALVVAVALVGFITVFAASAEESISGEVDSRFRAGLVVQAGGSFFGPPSGFSPALADEIAALDGVDEVSPLSFLQGQVDYGTAEDGTEDVGTQFIQTIDPETAILAFTPTMYEGEATDLGPDGIIVDVGVAEDHGLAIGDTLTVTGPTGIVAELTVDALSDDLFLMGPMTLSSDTYAELVPNQQLIMVMVLPSDGADLDALTAEIEAVVQDVPTLQVLDKEGFIGDLASQITSFLTFIYVLLGLSVLIAAIGIANTLSLSIHERTRELGLLRAVGMTRSQLRSSVRWEAVLISVLGTLVGLGVGMLISFALVSCLDDYGLTRFVVPVGSMTTLVLLAALIGVAASIMPSRRAARLQVLDAIAEH